MRVPDPLLKCVAFVGIQLDKKFSYGGTCFFVSHESSVNKDLMFTYLVTAKHCVDQFIKKNM